MIAFILKLAKRWRIYSHKRKIAPYVKMGDSFFYESFRIINYNKLSTEKKTFVIGDNTILDCTIILDSDQSEVIIGDNNWIGASRFSCRKSITIEDNVFISWGAYISDHDSHSINYLDRQNDILQQLENYKNKKSLLENKNWDVVNSESIKICSNVWIGMNCIILKGVTIGEGAIVAAGSVVTKNIPAWTVVAGNPARVVKMLDK
jgi:galactoside O-acetyltransferase